jgi:hypothetical protein
MVAILKSLMIKVSAIILLIALAVAACQTIPDKTDLSYESIEQKASSGSGKLYEAKEPGLLVIAQPKETENLGGLITEEALQKLLVLDYNKYFALIVFQGWKTSGGYSIQVVNISRVDETVNINIVFYEPKPDAEKADVITSPYHVVIVQKTGKWDREITFNLVSDEGVLDSLSHSIP